MIPKVACEICELRDKKILHYHHIIPQCDDRCTNGWANICVVCPNCHMRIHTGDIIILGVYSSTNGRCLVWHAKNEPAPFSKEHWMVKDNPLVLTLGGDTDDLPNNS